MAQRISEQVVELLTVGGDSFTPKNIQTNGNIPLVVSVARETPVIPATNSLFGSGYSVKTGLSFYNLGQLWTKDVLSTQSKVKSSQLIVSSEDGSSSSGGISAVEFWRGAGVSWRLGAESNDDFFIRNNKGKNSGESSSSLKDTYAYTNIAIGFGNIDEQYVRIYSEKDSNYSYSEKGAALVVDGGAIFAKKVFIESDINSTSNVTGALTLNGGIGLKGNINPTDNSYYLGSVGYKWKGLWLKETSSANSEGIQWSNATTGNPTARIGVNTSGELGIYGTNNLYFRPSMSLSTVGMQLTSTALYPAATNAIDLGTTSYRWRALYIGTSNTYGSNTQPIYWNTGVPTALTYTANRWYYSASTTSFEANGYAASGKMTIAGTSAPANSGAFQVVGTSTLRTVYPEANATYTLGVTGTRWKSGFFTDSIHVGAANTTSSNLDTVIIPGDVTIGRTSSGGGLYLFGNGTTYGRFYISTIGTAGTYTPASGGTPASSTNGTQGHTILQIGNSISVTPSSETSLGANNSRGRIRIYGTGTTYTDLYSNPNGSKSVYLPYGTASNMYLAWTSAGNTAEGSGTQPVYAAAGGKITASTSTVGSTTKPIYMSSGVLTASNSTVGSGSNPIYLSSGTLTASSNTVGSATKGTYLSSGTITAMTYSLNATVNDGTSTALAYYSGANAISSEPRIRQHRSNRYPLDFTLHTDATQVAEFWYDTGSTTNITAGSWRFREYSPNSTADTATTGHYENYFLPTVTTGRTTDASYTIYTTKNNPTFLDIYEARSATTNLNKAAGYSGVGRMFHLVASSSTTTGKPPTDANILQMNWDNNGGYDSQFGISTSDNRGFLRSQVSAGNAWREIATIAAGTATGGSRTPVYVSATGKITACYPEVAYWSISNTAAAASGAHDAHAARYVAAIQGVFSSHNNSLPESFMVGTGNTSAAFGYLISGTSYNTTGTAYGGYFIAHYGSAKYLGISNGTWQVHRLVFGCSGGYYGALSSRPASAHNGDVYFAI